MKTLFAALALAAVAATGAAAPICGTAHARSCCKVCTTGKACGNSCIAQGKTCRKGKGCACNG